MTKGTSHLIPKTTLPAFTVITSQGGKHARLQKYHQVVYPTTCREKRQHLLNRLESYSSQTDGTFAIVVSGGEDVLFREVRPFDRLSHVRFPTTAQGRTGAIPSRASPCSQRYYICQSIQ
jgi:hypothetical protein